MRIFITLSCSDLSRGECKRGNPEESIKLKQEEVRGHTQCWWHGANRSEQKPRTNRDLTRTCCQRADAAAQRSWFRGALRVKAWPGRETQGADSMLGLPLLGWRETHPGRPNNSEILAQQSSYKDSVRTVQRDF